MISENEKLMSTGLFDFDKWTYNVLREDVENNFLEKMFLMKNYRTRYWITAVRKGPYVEKRYMEILCHYKTPYGCLYRFLPSERVYYPIKYWSNPQEPTELLYRLRAKLDVESFPESLVFSSDDI